MKTAQFKRQLAAAGATFKQGGKHIKVYLNGKQTTLPRHKEISDLLVELIRKQLNVK
ncbi:type II toxin-antitoxin system HicA family toxin [Xanthomonas sp. SHU 199]|uniref:type II toxin-antitoxin system HicA family toxin n=1 Tax=Xanthomonas sp. SHU 199 TaxID=1591174 RepID=UPI0012FEFB00